jgi:hypothetical protein
MTTSRQDKGIHLVKSKPDFRRLLMVTLLVGSTALPVFWAVVVIAHHLDWLSNTPSLRSLDMIIAEAPLHLQAATVVQSTIMGLSTALFLARNKVFVLVFAFGVLVHAINWAQTAMLDSYDGQPGIFFLGLEFIVLYLAVDDLFVKPSSRSDD